LEKTNDPEFPLEECINVHKILQKEFGEIPAEAYKKNCQRVFQYARYFSDNKEEEPKKEPEVGSEEDGDTKD